MIAIVCSDEISQRCQFRIAVQGFTSIDPGEYLGQEFEQRPFAEAVKPSGLKSQPRGLNSAGDFGIRKVRACRFAHSPGLWLCGQLSPGTVYEGHFLMQPSADCRCG